jgi:hypothetical protein
MGEQKKLGIPVALYGSPFPSWQQQDSAKITPAQHEIAIVSDALSVAPNRLVFHCCNSNQVGAADLIGILVTY